MRVEVHGPFDVHRTQAGFIEKGEKARYYCWDWVDRCNSDLPEACGCYIYAIKVLKGMLSWCIGKAERQSYRIECITPHKIFLNMSYSK